MLLPHLIPHLDAEIARLQKARDLLATESSSEDNYLGTGQRLQQRTQHPDASQRFARMTAIQAVAAEPVASSNIAPGAAMILPPVTYLKGRRRSEGRSESRLHRKKQAAVIDTALSGAVPAGPVVVSAEQVRKAQAAKTAQSELSAEVKKADGDFASVLSWRNRTEEASSADSMLQRLMQMGKGHEATEIPDPLSSFESRGRSGSVRAPLAPESE